MVNKSRLRKEVSLKRLWSSNCNEVQYNTTKNKSERIQMWKSSVFLLNKSYNLFFSNTDIEKCIYAYAWILINDSTYLLVKNVVKNQTNFITIL